MARAARSPFTELIQTARSTPALRYTTSSNTVPLLPESGRSGTPHRIVSDLVNAVADSIASPDTSPDFRQVRDDIVVRLRRWLLEFSLTVRGICASAV